MYYLIKIIIKFIGLSGEFFIVLPKIFKDCFQYFLGVHIVFSVYASVDQKIITNNPYNLIS